MTARPLIGITACARALGEDRAQVVIERYLDAVSRHADCAAVLLPARPDLMTAHELAGRIDGLMLTGSPSNVAPARYGSEEAGDGPFDAGRDAMSLALVDAMIARGRPVFGICRGFQELNVAFGGTLRRDMSAPGRVLPHHAADGVRLDAMFGHRHDVSLAPGGVLASVLQRTSLSVNSVHFQGVDRLGDGLAIEARAPDGVAEAVSARIDDAVVLGVQWHPEWRTDADETSLALFGLFGRALRGDVTAWQNREYAR